MTAAQNARHDAFDAAQAKEQARTLRSKPKPFEPWRKERSATILQPYAFPDRHVYALVFTSIRPTWTA